MDFAICVLKVLYGMFGCEAWAVAWALCFHTAMILTSALLCVLALISLRVLFTLGAVVSGFPGLMLLLLVLSWAGVMLILFDARSCTFLFDLPGWVLLC